MQLLLLLGVLLGAVPLLPQLVDLLVPVLEAGLQAGQRALAAVALRLDLIKTTVNTWKHMRKQDIIGGK